MGEGAVRAALADAGLDYADVQQAYVGYVYGDSTAGQNVLLPGRHDGHAGRQREQQLLHRLHRALARPPGDRGRRRRVVLALGFEQMEPGALGDKFTDRRTRSSKFVDVMNALAGLQPSAAAPRRCSAAPAASTAGSTAPSARRSPRSRAKARRHAANNPYAMFREAAHGRGGAGVAEGLRSAHALPVLPADLRRGGGGPVLRRVREEARHHDARVRSRRRP